MAIKWDRTFLFFIIGEKEEFLQLQQSLFLPNSSSVTMKDRGTLFYLNNFKYAVCVKTVIYSSTQMENIYQLENTINH